ncbi:hypothetical protein DAI22_02g188700 [Oryza sativa Japonica Group]|uniref:Uncharacterized protein n=1 Tax=Oryza rufipogon TaxID=4529 RepID=A0A0E0NFL2_ORYRU|nr:hypothetical protein DAI22_02g188700 [Oryza sativa Japonica Group]
MASWSLSSTCLPSTHVASGQTQRAGVTQRCRPRTSTPQLMTGFGGRRCQKSSRLMPSGLIIFDNECICVFVTMMARSIEEKNHYTCILV